MTTNNDAVLLEAIASLTQSMEDLKAQNVEVLEQNKDLQGYMRKQLSAIPLTVKEMLNAFIAQFKQALEEQKSDKMSDSLKELSEAMHNLSMKLENTSMVQLQVNEQVMSAYEEIMSQKKQNPPKGQRQSPMSSGNGQPTSSGQQP